MRKIFILLSVTSLFACSPDDREVRVNNKYSITLPEGMKPVTGLNEEASLQHADEAVPLYVVVIDESKEEMQQHDLDYDLDLYYNNIVSRNFVESLSEVSISEPAKDSISGSPAYLVDVSGKAESGSIYYKLAIIETPSAFYQVLMWTTAGEREEQQPVMEKIARSFKE